MYGIVYLYNGDIGKIVNAQRIGDRSAESTCSRLKTEIAFAAAGPIISQLKKKHQFYKYLYLLLQHTGCLMPYA